MYNQLSLFLKHMEFGAPLYSYLISIVWLKIISQIGWQRF